MKTLQQIFDEVASFLLKQGDRAADDLSCRYRMTVNQHTTKCAVGCLIPDADYNTDMEGNSITYVRGHLDEEGPDLLIRALKRNGVDCDDEDTMNLLEALQRVHDAEEPSNWASALEDVAVTYKLNNTAALQ